ncbi:MAG TPA: isoprenylcysteine carboxylmethyltransferase family protein [archaeon]|nr:isoprenylcysteine carboxylmethyltransferase family protein [archaeon]
MHRDIPELLLHLFILATIVVFRDQFGISDILINIFSAVITISGIVILVAGRLTIDSTLSSKKAKLCTKGIYSKIRHPVYVGRIMFFLGLTLLFKSAIGIFLVITIFMPYHINKIKKEEQELIKIFGRGYLNYRKKTIF